MRFCLFAQRIFPKGGGEIPIPTVATRYVSRAWRLVAKRQRGKYVNHWQGVAGLLLQQARLNKALTAAYRRN